MYLLTLLILTILLPLILVLGGMKKGMLPYAVILQSGLFIGFSLVLMFGFAWSMGEPLGASILKETGATVKIIVDDPNLLKTFGLEGVGKEEATKVLTSAYALVINMIPSSIICWGIIFSYFDYSILSKIKRRKNAHILMLPAFSDFSLPRKAIYGSLLIYSLSWIAAATKLVSEEALLLNVQALIEFIFAAQGLAVTLYTLKQKKVNKFIAGTICMILFVFPFGRMFLALFGFFDLLVGFRQKLEKQ